MRSVVDRNFVMRRLPYNEDSDPEIRVYTVVWCNSVDR